MIVIAGTSELWPTPSLASKVLAIMVSTPSDIAIRCDARGTIPSMVEELVMRIGSRIDRTVVRFEANGHGSSAGFSRDVRMVRASSGVFAFFGSEGPVEGGTAHVVACALREGRPVVAYGLDVDGCIIEIGSDAGEVYVRDYYHAPTPGVPNEEIGWRR